MAKQILAAALLRELFDYDPHSGLVRYKVSISSKSKAGQEAGCEDSDGYLVVGLFQAKYKLHRVIWAMMTGEHPDGEIDHRNGIKTDNRWENLRDVSKSLNAQNIRTASPGKQSSNLLGVTFEKQSGLWKAQIGVGGKTINLGRYDTPEEAHRSYLTAKRELHAGCTL
jgi:hypothetical protein